jgi:hypothetical protein
MDRVRREAMLSLLFLAAAATGSPPRAVIPADPAKKMVPLCVEKGAEPVGGKANHPVGAQKLNELPNANAYQAVIRRDADGCSKPSIIGYDIGSAPHRQR